MVIEVMVLSAFLQALFQSIMSPFFDEFFRARERKEMKVILGELETTLLIIRASLSDDTNEKQITNQAVEDLVNKLKDAVYHAEDVLDYINTEASLHKATIRASLPKETISCKNLLDKLMDVKKTLYDLASHINVISKQLTTTTNTKSLTTSLIGEQRLIGRKTEKENIMKRLLINKGKSKLTVVAIVGMGGAGKTKLAQELFNEGQFTVKAWIHVSEKDDVFSLTKKICESVTRSPFPFEDLNLLHHTLMESLKNKKFLLVLDDMNESFEDWNLLCQPYASAAKESRIIVTTRSHHVARNVCARDHIFILHPLPYEDCWDIFMEQVRGDQKQDLNRELGTLAEQIVHKCQGLPLAAKAFGHLLQPEREVDYWRGVLKSKIWTATTKTRILPVLRVSYHCLPLHLKRCFAYCSIFPKRYAFDRKMVVLFWMSEGLLHKDKGSTERMEDVGERYFEELVSMSLFQQKSDTKFIMHDFINELAQFAAGEFCFKYEDQIQGMTGKTRHFSYLRDQYSGEAMKFEELRVAKFLRTFLPLSLKDSSQTCYLDKMVRDKLLPGLTCLRVLSLSRYKITMLPSDIFKRMRHIRYLDLSGTYLKTLPASVGFLYNLETLLLSYCPNLIQLEETICNLISLTYIDLTATRLNQMPKSFGKLTRLQTLTTFVVSAGKGAAISALRDLTELRGKLAILELHRVKEIWRARSI